MPQLPNELFTVQSMLTLTGATGCTFVVSNGLQRAFNFNPKWLALAVAQVVSIVGAILAGGNTFGTFFVAVINGFLIYSSAAGFTQAAGGGSGRRARARGVDEAALPQPPQDRRRFLSPWF